MAMPKILLSLSRTPPPTIPKTHPHPTFPFFFEPVFSATNTPVSRRSFILTAFTTSSSSLVALSSADALAEPPPPPPPPPPSSNSSKSFLSGIANTKSWFQFYGDGFAIRVPPNFEDIMEPEDDNAGLSLYGDKVKPKTYAARFASPDGRMTNLSKLDKNIQFVFSLARVCYNVVAMSYRSEVLSVVIRPSNQLKITFLEAKDIADLGSLKEAAKIFVPGGAKLYSARTIKIKEEEGYRNYYFYEFGKDEQHFALVAAVNGGKAIIAGATAPQKKWDDDGVQLRSAAVSLTLL